MRCVYCQQTFADNLTLAEIFSFTKILPKELCGACRSLFTLNKGLARCMGCDKESDTKYCEDCRYWQKLIPGVELNHSSLFCYDEALHDWFQDYKFKGDINLATSFARELSAYFHKQSDWLVIPIPLSEKRLKIRGFNQVEELLKAAMIPYLPILEKQRGGGSQSTKTRLARLASKQRFYLPEKDFSLINNRSLILVDDVYTTGRTMLHAKACLAKAQPKEIKTFSLAR